MLGFAEGVVAMRPCFLYDIHKCVSYSFFDIQLGFASARVIKMFVFVLSKPEYGSICALLPSGFIGVT